jgi:hypothetical protein
MPVRLKDVCMIEASTSPPLPSLPFTSRVSSDYSFNLKMILSSFPDVVISYGSLRTLEGYMRLENGGNAKLREGLVALASVATYCTK